MTHHLTPRQLTIIERLTVPGATQQSVANDLGIEVQTVKNHLQVVYRNLGVRSLAQATRVLRKRTAVR